MVIALVAIQKISIRDAAETIQLRHDLRSNSKGGSNGLVSGCQPCNRLLFAGFRRKRTSITSKDMQARIRNLHILRIGKDTEVTIAKLNIPDILIHKPSMFAPSMFQQPETAAN